MWTKVRRSLSAKRPEPAPALAPVATSYVLPGGEKEMSCLVKEIPIPKGLLVDNLMCVLCEHAVVLLEVSQFAILPKSLWLISCQAVRQEIGRSDKWSVLSCNLNLVIVLDASVYFCPMTSFVTLLARIE